MTETERERLAVLEVQMETLMGNGKPGVIHDISRLLESHSRMLYIGMGILVAIQAVTGAMVALIAAGVIKIR